MAAVLTNIPQRLDRLPWARWHWTIVIGLGITWILDGLEVTMVGSIGSRLQEPQGLSLTATDVGFSATVYLVGAVVGSLVFGYLTDRFGRKKLFLITLAWYLVATLLTATSWNVWSFLAFRFLTGLGIGGEYSAINSTIDELIPAARRGWVDLAINGTYWFGAILGSGASIVLLDPRVVDQHVGWRLAFGLGAVLAVGIVFIRKNLPESPRWLLTHGRPDEAEATLAEIEATVRRQTGGGALPEPHGAMEIDTARRHRLRDVWHAMIGLVSRAHRRRVRVNDHAGVLIQRDLLHGIARTYDVLPRSAAERRLLYLSVRPRKSARAAVARPLFRQRRAAADDCGHVCSFGRAALGHGRALRARPARRHDHHALLVCRFLFCLGRRERGLSDGKRDVSAGDSGDRNRDRV